MTNATIPRPPLVVRVFQAPQKSAAEVLQQEFITRADFEALCGRKWSNSHLRNLERRGEFPQRIYLTNRRVVYRRDDVVAWMETKARRPGIRNVGRASE